MARKQTSKRSRVKPKPVRKVVFDHDSDPDFSWLEQDMYNPRSKDYSPVYRSEADMKAGKDPIDGDWYRNPDNHVALSMLVYEQCPECGEWKIVDSLGSIDFLADSDDWKTGTFTRVSELPEGYLRELAKEAGLQE